MNCSIPPLTDRDGYAHAIEALPLVQTPEVFGLHANADISYYTSATKNMWRDLVDLQPRVGVASSGMNLSLLLLYPTSFCGFIASSSILLTPPFADILNSVSYQSIAYSKRGGGGGGPLSSSKFCSTLHGHFKGLFLQQSGSKKIAAIIPKNVLLSTGVSREEFISGVARDVASKIPEPFDLPLLRKEIGIPTPTQVVLLQELERWNHVSLPYLDTTSCLPFACQISDPAS